MSQKNSINNLNKETLKSYLPKSEPSIVKSLSPKNLWKNMTGSSFKQIKASEEDYILIEDFQIISHLGLILLDEKGKVITEETPDKEFRGFCHLMRTERLVHGSFFLLIIFFLIFYLKRNGSECGIDEDQKIDRFRWVYERKSALFN